MAEEYTPSVDQRRVSYLSSGLAQETVNNPNSMITDRPITPSRNAWESSMSNNLISTGLNALGVAKKQMVIKELNNRFSDLLVKGEQAANQAYNEARTTYGNEVVNFIPETRFFKDPVSGEFDAYKYYERFAYGLSKFREWQQTRQDKETDRVAQQERNVAGLKAASTGMTPQEQFQKGIEGGAQLDVAQVNANFMQHANDVAEQFKQYMDRATAQPKMYDENKFYNAASELVKLKGQTENELALLKSGINPKTNLKFKAEQKGDRTEQIYQKELLLDKLEQNLEIVENSHKKFLTGRGTIAEALTAKQQGASEVLYNKQQEKDSAKIEAEKEMIDTYNSQRNALFNKYKKEEFIANYKMQFGIEPKFATDGSAIVQKQYSSGGNMKPQTLPPLSSSDDSSIDDIIAKLTNSQVNK